MAQTKTKAKSPRKKAPNAFIIFALPFQTIYKLELSSLAASILSSDIDSGAEERRNEIVFLVLSEVLKEYLAVLSSTKFRLTKDEIKSLIEVEVTPFIEPVKIRTKLRIIDKDPSDNKFLELAADGKVDTIVSSDKHLLRLGAYEGIEIISVAEFIRRLK